MDAAELSANACALLDKGDARRKVAATEKNVIQQGGRVRISGLQERGERGNQRGSASDRDKMST